MVVVVVVVVVAEVVVEDDERWAHLARCGFWGGGDRMQGWGGGRDGRAQQSCVSSSLWRDIRTHRTETGGMCR